MEWKTEILVSIVAVLVLGVGESLAEIVEISLVAETRYVDDSAGLLEGRIQVGDLITGSYVYDSATPDSKPSSATVGDYWHYGAPYGIFLSVGGFDFRTDPDNVMFLLEICNDHGGLYRDNYLLRSYNNLPLYEDVPVSEIHWQLDDSSGTALSSDALPVIPPLLSDWESVYGLSMGGSRTYTVRADVISVEVVPEPATLLLLALGGAAIIVERRASRVK